MKLENNRIKVKKQYKKIVYLFSQILMKKVTSLLKKSKRIRIKVNDKCSIGIYGSDNDQIIVLG